MEKNIDEFSDLAHLYASGRPQYAEGLLKMMADRYGLDGHSIVADIGSGTGIFAKQLLDIGTFVYGIEPSDGMREVAKKELGHYPFFESRKGTSSDTGLAENSVDFITVAQAFHWFDVHSFQKECKRIIKKEGSIFLIWNIRGPDMPINKRLEGIYRGFCPKFKGFSSGLKKDDPSIKAFFKEGYEYAEFVNTLLYDKKKFMDRCLSSSYSLREGDRDYSAYKEALLGLFDEYSDGDQLSIPNKTVAYIGQLP